MKSLVQSTWNKINPIDQSENQIMQAWKLLSRLPGGKKLFSYIIGKYVPYTGTISARVQEISPGYARVTMEDHKQVRNHLNSLHAIALANLCEMTGNLALISGMPADGRYIVTGMKLDYEKKARGTVTATAETPALETTREKEYEIEVGVTDEEGDVTTRARIMTLVGPDDS